ncbi:MAG TPA: hypothetical protein VI876_11405, partial [Dehalococcoidia bacterium]|nr:hypothetical protein [Dehalococcoidia bacterium]
SDQRMTPGKRTYLIPPLDPTLERFDSSRRSGVPIVDAVLDALQSSDPAPFDGLIDFHPVACGSRPQIGGPPPCPPGVAEGTPIPAISYGACEGGFLTSADSLTRKNIGEDFEVYAVVERPRTTAGSPPAWSVILSRSGSGSLAISVGSDGITSLHRGCGAFHPEWLTDQQSPDFLLPPP